jgi:hypothetical protein
MLLPQDDERVQAVRSRPSTHVHEVHRRGGIASEGGRQAFRQQRRDVEQPQPHGQGRR